MNQLHALKIAFENLILVEANWVVCWQGLLMRSPEACFHPAGVCCRSSACLLPHKAYNSKGVSFSLLQDSTCKPPPLQHKEIEPQPTFLSPLMSQNIPSVVVRLGRSRELTTGQWSKIHKSPPRRQRRDTQGARESRKWQCKSRDWAGTNRFNFLCSSIQGASFPISSQEAEYHCRVGDERGRYCRRWWPEWQQGGVERDLTSNVKVSRSWVASPSTVDCHALVLALVWLLAVLNLKCSWGWRPKCHSSRLHSTYWKKTQPYMVVE